MLLCVPAFYDNKNILEYVNDNSYFYKLIITICTIYNIEPIIIFTKCDLVNYDLTSNKEGILECFTNWSNEISYMSNINSIDFMDIKIIEVSNITELGYEELIDNISWIPIEVKQKTHTDIFFKFIEVFTIPDTGTIYHGTLCSGTINVDDTVEILCHNTIKKFKIKSIHRKSLNVDTLFAGETGSITFYGKTNNILDKTGIIIGNTWKSKIKTSGIFKLLSFTTELKEKQYLLYICNNILPVMVNFTENNYTFICVDNMPYLTDNNIAILRDGNDYFFIQIVS
jgi:selenocysteine-specific translation elongation factor